jgi:hypothetical protein
LEIRIIDTAGFETPDEEREHTETVAINQDMLAFKECIRAVADRHNFVPSRRRTITRVLFEHRTSDDIKNHIFVIGAIDPHYDTITMRALLSPTTPNHPKIGIIHNTLNYLTMLKCASVITTRRPITSRHKCKDILPCDILPRDILPRDILPRDILPRDILPRVKNQNYMILDTVNNKNNSEVSYGVIEQLNTIEPKYSDYIPIKPKTPVNIDKPFFRLNRERRMSDPTDAVIVSPRDIQPNENHNNPSDMMQRPIDNRHNSEPTPVSRYINNQELLMKRMNALDFNTDKLKVLSLINDQQLLSITMQMTVLKCCDEI